MTYDIIFRFNPDKCDRENAHLCTLLCLQHVLENTTVSSRARTTRVKRTFFFFVGFFASVNGESTSAPNSRYWGEKKKIFVVRPNEKRIDFWRHLCVNRVENRSSAIPFRPCETIACRINDTSRKLPYNKTVWRNYYRCRTGPQTKADSESKKKKKCLTETN